MAKARIGVIGGSGLYEMPGLKGLEEVKVTTPFGDPSDVLIVGELEGVSVAFLPRHGKGHRLNPTEVPSKANIYALKSLGVEQVISVSAVGSLQEPIRPLDMVIPDQLIDRTRARPSTFFEDGIVAHVSFAEPFCPVVRALLVESVKETDTAVHDGGTYVVMEGPPFSTIAESKLYRSWGASIIGMTALPEAKLAREAEMCYATLACATDYDVWHDDHDSVTVDMVVANLMYNVATAQDVLRRIVTRLPDKRVCGCATALTNAVITSPDVMTPSAKYRLKLLLGDRVH
ncbi:MAG: S-methyl-5'-thioadenosine phosphorylase [SAR202 cluster bacterium]|nr:S-methyl-5'-thioadenosine phosphorylase [SAR202 cluster bacterium]